MNRKKEPCRYFLQGRCQYGARCKYSHTTQNQQQLNPYSFGAQNAQNNQVHQKERESRPFSQSGAGSSGFEKGGSQSNTTIHKCDDPKLCKQQIIEDYQKELPLWKLTCYGHWRNVPCDITGDISYEELRYGAYEDARRGLTLQQIVQKERSLVASKLEEFKNLQRNPYNRTPFSALVGSSSSASSSMFNSVAHFQSNTVAPVSGVSQIGNMGNQHLPFGSSSSSSLASHTPFQSNVNAVNRGVSHFGNVGNAHLVPSSAFGSLGSQFASHFGNITSNQSSSFPSPFGTSFQVTGSSKPEFQNQYSFGKVDTTSSNNSFHFSAPSSTSVGLSLGNQGTKLPGFVGIQNTSSGFDSLAKSSYRSSNSLTHGSLATADDIWLKDSWTIGQIPEDEPPPYARYKN